jgi:hypothetical protein
MRGSVALLFHGQTDRNVLSGVYGQFMWCLNGKMRRPVGEVNALFSPSRDSSTAGSGLG